MEEENAIVGCLFHLHQLHQYFLQEVVSGVGREKKCFQMVPKLTDMNDSSTKFDNKR